jgi:hypothetical protein
MHLMGLEPMTSPFTLLQREAVEFELKLIGIDQNTLSKQTKDHCAKNTPILQLPKKTCLEQTNFTVQRKNL